MLKFAIIFVLFAWLGNTLNAQEHPTFTIQSESFDLPQVNDLIIGHYDQKLATAVLLEVMSNKRFTESKHFDMRRDKYYYFAYLVDNQLSKAQDIVLRYPLFMRSGAYLYVDGKITEMAPYPGIEEHFHTSVPPGLSYIIGYRTSSMQVVGPVGSATIMDAKTYLEKNYLQWNISAGIFGAILIMVVYNLGMFLYLKKAYFFHYSTYSLFNLVVFLMIYGYIPYSVVGLASFVSLAWLSLVLFFHSSLELKRHAPLLSRLSWMGCAWMLAMTVYAEVMSNIGPALMSTITLLFLAVVISYYRYHQGFRPALYFLLGWAILGATALMTFMKFYLYLNPIFHHTVLFGFMAEVCLFSFAISQKTRMKEQKSLEEQEHAFNQLKKVFFPHQINRIKLGDQLEQTMPTGNAEACVLSFDIARSSSINHPHVKIFLQDAIKACLSLLDHNYDSEQLTASGYRIKEMGDGFLCSIGYPFAVPDGKAPQIFAYELAETMIRIFQSKVEQHLSGQVVHCSIGLAFDRIEGFFPQTGTIEYDVYGRSIILATRYEAMRKEVFPFGLPGHIVTVHEKVYETLPTDMQEQFTSIDLQQGPLKVRDDPISKKLYYRVFPTAEVDAGRTKIPV